MLIAEQYLGKSPLFDVQYSSGQQGELIITSSGMPLSAETSLPSSLTTHVECLAVSSASRCSVCSVKHTFFETRLNDKMAFAHPCVQHIGDPPDASLSNRVQLQPYEFFS